jgi:hypothetical protein
MKNKVTGELHDMVLSLSEREDLLAGDEWTQVLSTASFISGVKSPLAMAGNGWKEVLHKVKSGSARNNTIHD